jgi:hypothetical protein
VSKENIAHRTLTRARPKQASDGLFRVILHLLALSLEIKSRRSIDIKTGIRIDSKM